MVGFYTLLYKELLRFWRVVFQTVAAPILTALLYLLIFSHILQDRVTVYIDVGYTQFLVPGLAMMSVLQNAFANGSSSIIQSKVTGNIVFLLLAPISNFQVFLAFYIFRNFLVHNHRLLQNLPLLENSQMTNVCK